MAEAPSLLSGSALEYALSSPRADHNRTAPPFDPFRGLDPFVSCASLLARLRGVDPAHGARLGLPRLLALSIEAVESNALTRLASGSITASAALTDLPTLSFDVSALFWPSIPAFGGPCV